MPANDVYWPTFQNEYEPSANGCDGQWSIVPRPFHAEARPGITGSICSKNDAAWSATDPLRNVSPTRPPVESTRIPSRPGRARVTSHVLSSPRAARVCDDFDT